MAITEADLIRGQYVDPRAGRVTFDHWADEWLARPGKRANSVVRDRQALEVWRAELGARPLGAITAMHVQVAVDARAQVAAPATVARDFSALRAVFNAAVDADLIARSPGRKTKLPRVRAPEQITLTAEELLRLTDEVPAIYRALVFVGGVLGLRWGEAVGLRVRDIDFLRRRVTVAQVVEEVAGKVTIIAEAKSASGLRTLTVPAFLIEILAAHLAEHRPGADGDDLVFIGPRGGVLRRRFGERTLHPAIRRAGLPDSLTFHGLRYVAISSLAEEQVHPSTMQQRAGHASARLMLELYTKVTDASDQAAAAALDARFRAAVSRHSGTGVARRASKRPSAEA